MDRRAGWLLLALSALLLSGFSGKGCHSAEALVDEDSGNLLEPACEPLACDVYCEHGHVKDAEGCDTCACLPPPECPGVLCDVYCEYGHVKDAEGCDTCACLPSPECPDVLCELYCYFGNVLDEAGCPICECLPPPPCETDADCPADTTCALSDCGPGADCGGPGVCTPVPPDGDDVACIQVIAFAADPATGACLAFPTPCDVPAGWAPCEP